MKSKKNNFTREAIIAVIAGSSMLVATNVADHYDVDLLNVILDQQEEQEVVTPSAEDESLLKVTEEFNKIENQEDKILIYKLFAGAAEYLSICESLEGTYQFDAILGRVQSSYGWEREKYSSFTDAVSDYLVNVGYDEPKLLTTKEQRMAFAKIFENLSEAVKL